MKTLSLISLGCDKNGVDSEVALGKLFTSGYTVIDPPEEADWIVLNTCAFVESACAESRQWIEKISALRRLDPNKRIMVMGCYAQRFGKQASQEFPEVDFWVGTNDFPRIVHIFENDIPGISIEGSPYLYDERTERVLSTPDHYAFVKIAEGCSSHCTFCIIPRIRGQLRSRTIESVEREVENLCARGVREIILLAQDLGSYGLDRYGHRSLIDLLRRLGQCIPAKNWLRLLYLSPESLDERLIEIMVQVPQIVPYLDIPIQHTDPGILKKMGRKTDMDVFYRMIARIRQTIPGLFVRSTVMVGFPGEDQAAFQNLLDWVAAIRFERLGVFCYSEQKDTASCHLQPKVPSNIAEERFQEIIHHQYRIMEEIHRSLVGQTMQVILDTPDNRGRGKARNRYFIGRTCGDAPEVDCQVKVDRSRRNGIRPGDIVPVTIIRGKRFELTGVIP